MSEQVMPEYAVSGSPVKLHAGNNTGGLVVRFYSREIPLIKKFPLWVDPHLPPGDSTGGQRVADATEHVDFVQISHPGENLNQIDRRATDEDRKRYAEQYQRYVDGKEQRPDGIPLNLLFAANPGVVKALEAQSIFTVQQLANLSSHGIESVGMGCQAWVNSAVKYMEHVSKGVDVHRFESTIAELETHNSELKQEVVELRSAVDRLLKAMPSERTDG